MLLLYLVFLGALQELLELGVELGEAAGDALYPRVQVPVLAVLRVEVVLVALALLRRRDGRVFSAGGKQKGLVNGGVWVGEWFWGSLGWGNDLGGA